MATGIVAIRRFAGQENLTVCRQCGLPVNAPGHSGHYTDNVAPSRQRASTANGPQGKKPFELGGEE